MMTTEQAYQQARSLRHQLEGLLPAGYTVEGISSRRPLYPAWRRLDYYVHGYRPNGSSWTAASILDLQSILS